MAAIALRDLDPMKDRAVAELVDAAAIEDFGSMPAAAFHVCLALGFSDGEAIEMQDAEHVVLPHGLETVRARMEKALALKREGLGTREVLGRVG